MRDWFEMGVGVLVVVCLLVVVIGWSADAASNSWIKDCEKIGMHREGGRVFICSERKQ